MTISIPQPLAPVSHLMAGFAPQWCLCGGWAVDGWLGRQTRDHKDIDIAIFEDGQRDLFDHLRDWELIAHDAEVDQDTEERWDGRRLTLPAHVHARPADGSLELEFLVNQRDADDWVFSREPRIGLPVSRCVRESAWGLPAAAPEVLLFYKTTAYYGIEGLDLADRPQDTADFLALLSVLTPETQRWLSRAIATLHPGHPWQAQLDRRKKARSPQRRVLRQAQDERL